MHVAHERQEANDAQGRDADERAIAEFDALVKVGPATLDRWLETDQSRNAGRRENAQSVGDASGRHIVKILHKKISHSLKNWGHDPAKDA